MAFKDERRSLLSSRARIQVPWIKVTIGDYTFGVFSKTDANKMDNYGNYTTLYNVTYPNFIQRLDITKINGQVNQYTLNLSYPVRPQDDPNFFEKVLSSVSATREIIFSYGDMSQPGYVYREEKAIITKVTDVFNLQGGILQYTISATSSAALSSLGNSSFRGKKAQPSEEIKRILLDGSYGLGASNNPEQPPLFTGITPANIDILLDRTDKVVQLETKSNISPLDYITYLVSCMIPSGETTNATGTSDVYVMTIHDDTSYDNNMSVVKSYDNVTSAVKEYEICGSYIEVRRVSKKYERTDAMELDIGVGMSGTIVTNFTISKNENYALMYEYTGKLNQEQYVKRLNNKGQWEEVWAPEVMSNNSSRTVRAQDIAWWSKVTQYPIKATVTMQGLLRPALLMTYVRLNVIFPGGNKHISSGLYLVTSQKDSINGNEGYKTTLELTKISGDDYDAIYDRGYS